MEPPTLVEPADAVEVSAAERLDLTLEAADLLPTTRVELDGESWSLTEPGPVVREGQTLRVPLAGAMVVAEHELVLVHEADGEPLRSDPLTISVSASALGPVSAELGPDPVGVGDRLVELSRPGVVALVDAAAETVELRVDDWAAAGSTLALPGLTTAAGPSDASVELGFVERDGGAWLIVAWLAADGGEARVRSVAVDADGALGEAGPVASVWDLADADAVMSIGPHELVFNRGVALLDRLVVVAVEARRDAEAATPGDRVLVTRWLDPNAGLADVQVVRGPGGRDLDLPRQSAAWLDRGSTPALSVRVAQAYPWLLELGGNGLPTLTSDPGELVSAAGPAVVWMAAVEGGFGSRTGFALVVEGEQAWLRVLRIDRWGTAPVIAASPVDEIALPAVPTAPPSLSLIAGAPALALGFGPDEPVLLARSTGDATELEPLALECDAVVVERPGPSGESSGSLALACLRERALRVGQLTLE